MEQAFNRYCAYAAIAFAVYLMIASFNLLPLPHKPFPVFVAGWAFFGWGYNLLKRNDET